LILLDLKLPRVDGHAVLAEIRRAPAFRSIPVVVLTSSSNAQDILRAEQLKCSCYMSKPAGIEEFAKLIDAITFWLGVAGATARD
jgi:CheY-like chemotaxis protein